MNNPESNINHISNPNGCMSINGIKFSFVWELADDGNYYAVFDDEAKEVKPCTDDCGYKGHWEC